MTPENVSPTNLASLLASCDLGTEALWWMDVPLVQRHMLTRRVEQHRGKQIATQPQQTGSIVVVDVQGVLMNRADYYGEIDMGQLADLFRSIAANESIAAVVLNMDSPGGTCAGMPNLMAAMGELAAAKPVVSYVGQYCCSACYCLATPSQKIIAGPRTMVGSIGTRMMLYDFSGYFAELGVEAIAIDTGTFKSMGAMGTKVTEEHRNYLQAMTDTLQTDFAAAVKTGRKFDDAAYAKVSDARVFLAEEALEVGLIDGVGSLAEAIAAAAELAAPKQLTLRSKSMSETNTNNEPQAATLAELKENLPGATSDFMLEQLEKKATLTQAMKAHLAKQAELNASLASEKEAAEQRATDAEKKAAQKVENPAPKKVGNSFAPKQDSEGEGEGSVDYRAMANEYMSQHKCRWSEACLEIKRRYPESRAFFGAPPKV